MITNYMDQSLKQDILIIKKFQQIKLPLWLLLSPIFGTMVFITFFRSFFKALSEREFAHMLFLKIHFYKTIVMNLNLLLLIFIFSLLGLFTNDIVYVSVTIPLIIILIIFQYIYQYKMTKWVIKNIDVKFKNYYLKKYHQEINMDIDIDTPLDIDINQIFYEFKYKLWHISKTDFIYKKPITFDYTKYFHQESAYKTYIGFHQYFYVTKNFRASFSNIWYLGMMYLLNLLNPVIDANKIKKFLILVYIKNFFFYLLYLANYLFIVLAFLLHIWELDWINITNALAYSYLFLIFNFAAIFLVHCLVSKLINLIIKKIILKDIKNNPLN